MNALRFPGTVITVRSLDSRNSPASPPNREPPSQAQVKTEVGLRVRVESTGMRECAFTATAISAPTFFASSARSFSGMNIALVSHPLSAPRADFGGEPRRPRQRGKWRRDNLVHDGIALCAASGGRWDGEEGRKEGKGASQPPSKYRPPPRAPKRELRPREQSFTSRSTADKTGPRRECIRDSRRAGIVRPQEPMAGGGGREAGTVRGGAAGVPA